MYSSGGGGCVCVFGMAEKVEGAYIKWVMYAELVIIYRGRWVIGAGV